MRILFFAMPDTSDAIETASRLPNLAIVSMAGSLTNHDVCVLDLVLKKPTIKKAITDAIGPWCTRKSLKITPICHLISLSE